MVLLEEEAVARCCALASGFSPRPEIIALDARDVFPAKLPEVLRGEHAQGVVIDGAAGRAEDVTQLSGA